MMKRLILLICVAIALASPVMATITNISGDAVALTSVSYLHDNNYMPVQYVYALAVIGLLSLLVSRIWESANDIFAIGAVLPTALAAWWSNYSTLEYTQIIYGTSTNLVNVQIVTPNPYLSITLIVFTVLAVINVAWIFFLQPADKKTGGA